MFRFVCLLPCFFLLCSCDKRLLLTDQNVVQALQTELQTIRTKMQSLESSQQQLTAQNAVIESDNAALRSENTALRSDIDQIKGQVTNIQQNIPQGLSTYIIWGRKDCPHINGTSLIYSGITASKHYDEVGSGVTTLCLPHDPDSVPSDALFIGNHKGYYGKIWGSEYQFTYRNVAINDDAPCAVCQTQAQSAIMVPGKSRCPSGWKKEYVGLLIGTWTHDHPSDYICMDENPEFFEGTRSHDDNGRTLYPIRAACGNLPCPPYVNGQYLSCIVCSQ